MLTFLAVGNTPSDNNATNFSSLPANCYPFDINNWGKYAYFWSSTSFNSADAWRRVLVNEGRTVERSYGTKTVGSSVRCVRD